MSIENFTEEDRNRIDQIHGYGELIFIDDHNLVKWKTTNGLVEVDVLKDLFRYGYVSANAMMTTANQRGEQGAFE